MKLPFKWDHLSDQPHIIKDKKFKKSLKKLGFFHYIKSFFVALLTLPIIFLIMPFFRFNTSKCKGADFIGLCVNQDKDPHITPAFIKQLGVKKILVRIPLWDCDNLDAYKAFCLSLGDVEILFCVLQDREHVTNTALLKENIYHVFDTLSCISTNFQIGNATNRLKWGFVSVEESLRFFSVVKAQRDTYFKDIKLVGSSVIDFEPVSTVRSLFHFYNAKADAMAALLYIDRRGAPENTQGWIFDFKNKIRFTYCAMRLSPNIKNDLYITEINWPLKDRPGYAPAKGACTVSEKDAALYLVRSYLLAWATGQVTSMYWHQLIAPGYGLIDNRNVKIRTMLAFDAFKTLLYFLKSAQLTNYIYRDYMHHLSFVDDSKSEHIEVKWQSIDARDVPYEYVHANSDLYDFLGAELSHQENHVISWQPIYEIAQMQSSKKSKAIKNSSLNNV